MGFSPIVPHALGAAGIYGAPNEDDDGTCRAAALACGEATAAAVARAGGGLWVILKDDLRMSEGTQLERIAYREEAGSRRVVLASWASWQACIDDEAHWLRSRLSLE
jgi:hypothetical protein